MNRYYIDSANGKDSYSGLLPSDSWKTIGKFNAEHAPGDWGLLKSGGLWNEILYPKPKVLIAPHGAGPRPIINGSGHEQCVQIDDSDEVVLRGLHLTEPDEVAVHGGTSGISSKCVIEDCLIEKTVMTAILAKAQGWKVRRNIFRDIGTVLGRDHCVYFQESNDCIIEHNKMQGSFGWAVKLQNEVHDTIVRFNKAYDMASGFAMLYYWNGGMTTNTRVYGNVSIGGEFGISIGGADDVKGNEIYSNILYDMTKYGLYIGGNAHPNTFYDNLIWSTRPGVKLLFHVGTDEPWISDHNIIGPEAKNFIVWKKVWCSTLAEYQQASGQDAHSISSLAGIKVNL